MRKHSSALLTAFLVLLLAPLSRAAFERGDQNPDRDRAFSGGTAAVIVDVVVRDRAGKPVTDLRAKDFELYEDGVRQTITSLSLVSPASTTGGEGGNSPRADADSRAPAQPRAHVEAPTVVALVFDRLSPEGRALAHKGALAYLETAHPDDFAGVFLIDQSLQIIETFTNDRERLRVALGEAASRATSSFDPAGGRMHSVNRGDTRPGLPAVAGAEEHGPPVGATPTTPDPLAAVDSPHRGDPEVWLRLLANRMERSYEAMMHDQQGHKTAAGLLAIVDALGRLPGRKTMVFFAESLLIPPAVESAFRSVVATANRGNVSVYTVDAGGLRVQSKAAETARQIRALGAAGTGDTQAIDLIAGDGTGDRGADRAWTTDLELNEDILRQDPAASLGMLASWTGGFLINNTNDLDHGFRRIDADRRFHYLLTYTPNNEDFRGEYRRIDVEVPKRKVSVRSRHGYLAVRALSTIPLLAYEAPAVDALERTPLPAEIPIRGAAFSFPDPARPGLIAVLVEADSDALTFELDQQSGTLRTDFTILVRIRDAKGRVIRKASQPYRLSVPPGEAPAALSGDVLFFRQPSLPSGSYTLEYAVHDALGRKAGAGRTTFAVPGGEEHELQVSSLVIIERTEQVPAEDPAAETALFFDSSVLYPNLGTPVRKADRERLSYALSITGTSAADSVTATLTLEQDASEISTQSLEVPAPDIRGRRAILGHLPLAGIPPGEYTLRISVSRGGEVVERTVRFVLEA